MLSVSSPLNLRVKDSAPGAPCASHTSLLGHLLPPWWVVLIVELGSVPLTVGGSSMKPPWEN